jgi:hypothetical protein
MPLARCPASTEAAPSEPEEDHCAGDDDSSNGALNEGPADTLEEPLVDAVETVFPQTQLDVPQDEPAAVNDARILDRTPAPTVGAQTVGYRFK